MAFDVSQLVTDSFYIAAIKSRQANETPSVAEVTIGLDILNQIIDSLRLIAWFNSFLFTLEIDNPNQNIYIGNSITGGTGITVVNQNPLKLIFGASWTNSDSNYPLFIKSLADKAQTTIMTETGNPAYLFWANQLQGEKVFSNLFIYPTPNTPSVLNLSGFLMAEEFADSSADILPTFFNFLKYMVAKELAAQWGTLKLFLERGHDAQLDKFEKLLRQAAPVDTRPNDLSSLLTRNYRNEYPW